MDDREIVRRISAIIGGENTEDDCAVIQSGDRLLVASTDMLHEKTDFPKGITDRQIGWMSVAVTLSDIAGSGAQPVSVLIAAGIDSPLRIEEIIKGAKECCDKYGAKLSGGDVDSHSELTIVTTGIGIVNTENYVSRKGAAPGDIICVCGNLGHAQKGLSGDPRYFKDLCEPQPKVEEGKILGLSGITSMMDISDGLAISLYDLSELNECGFEIERELIPLHEGIDFDTALYGGGDFGLLYTCQESLFEKEGLPGFKIGRVFSSPGVRADGECVDKRGYSHIWDDKRI